MRCSRTKQPAQALNAHLSAPTEYVSVSCWRQVHGLALEIRQREDGWCGWIFHFGTVENEPFCRTALFFCCFRLNLGNHVCNNGGHYIRYFECDQSLIVWNKLGRSFNFERGCDFRSRPLRGYQLCSPAVVVWYVSHFLPSRWKEACHSFMLLMCLLAVGSSRIIFIFSMWN